MVDDQISRAVELAKAGHKSEARQIASAILRQDSDLVAAWVVMAQVVTDRKQAIDCLNNVLRLEPGHPWATLHLNRLQAAEDAARATVVSQRVQQTPPPEDAFMGGPDLRAAEETAIDAPLADIDLDGFVSAPAGSMAVPDELDPFAGTAPVTLDSLRPAQPSKARRRVPWLIFVVVFVFLLVIAIAAGAYVMGLLPF